MTVAHERPSQAEQRMLTAMATMTDELREVKTEVATLRGTVAETKDIVEAWGAVKTMGKFIKWLGALVAAVTAVAIGVKLGVQHMFGK
jgi:signal transduction histidine kinase